MASEDSKQQPFDLAIWGKNNVDDCDDLAGQGVALYGCTTDEPILGIPPGTWNVFVHLGSHGKQVMIRGRRPRGDDPEEEDEVSYEWPCELLLLGNPRIKRVPVENEAKRVKKEE